MEFFEVIEKRRSVRKFLDEQVPEEVIEKALQAALKAPNSSNLQPWEFYWVKDPQKKALLVEACLSQNAAKFAQDIIVIVNRINTWKRNRDFILEDYKSRGKVPGQVETYYKKLIPFFYTYGPLNILAPFKKVLLEILGLFKPMIRGPITKGDLFEISTKTTALAAENIMLALTAQGYSSCPMEGFDEKRIKKILNIGSPVKITMCLAIGKEDPSGIYGPQFRIDPNLVIFKV